MNKIITHEDLDGVVSAVLLIKATNIKNVIFSDELEYGSNIKIDKNTVISDLAYDKRCGMWFDHHITHKTKNKSKGSFKLEKSCTRVIFNYYKGNFPPYYRKLTEQLDKADSGDFTKEDVKNNIPLFRLNFFLLSYPFKEEERKKILNKILKSLLTEIPIEEIIKDREIDKYLKKFEGLNKSSLRFSKNKGKVINGVLIVDSSDKRRTFPIFQIYLVYPDINYFLIISKSEEKGRIGFFLVKNKFKEFNYKHIGEICQKYGGGGHKEIGGFRVNKKDKEKVFKEVISKISQ